MTQEEKDLLLKDLCARLPYGVKVKFYNIRVPKILFDISSKGIIIVTTRKSDVDGCNIFFPPCDIEKVVPYLRPMSDMTEEEYAEWTSITEVTHLDNGWEVPCMPSIDWLNKKHFDYRGLIPMGLALEAPEGMYKI